MPTSISDLDNMTKQNVPLSVRFSSEHRSRSVQLNRDWAHFEQSYSALPLIRINYVNCGKYPPLYLRETVRLSTNSSVFLYDGGMSHESLGKWARKLTGIQGTDLCLDLLSPNNRTFHKLLRTKSCVFAIFHAPDCRKCRRFMSSLGEMAVTFREENVSICEIDADTFKSIFFDF
jgi:hypothetical protein